MIHLFSVVLTVAQLHATAIPTGLTADDWRSDLHYLATELPRRHPNAFKYTAREEWLKAIDDLDARMPALTQNQRIVGLMRVVAMIRDGHTSLSPFFQGMLGFHRLPVRFQTMADGLAIVKADSAHAALVGKRVLRIGKLSADSALHAAGELTSAENEMYARHWGYELLAIPEVLNALGITDDPGFVDVVLENNQRVRLNTTSVSSQMDSHEVGPIHFDSAWVDVMQKYDAPRPLYLQAGTRLFNLAWMDSAKAVYAQYNAVRDARDETVAHFAERIFQMVDSMHAGRLVLDLRFNGGGNDYLSRPLIRKLIQSPINRPGGLFVLIGGGTFSAAQVLVEQIERYTDAIFVGEPTGQRSNFFSDPLPLFLPKTRIPVSVSSDWWQMDVHDARVWKAPDIYAPFTLASLRAGRDPALEEALSWRVDRTPVALIQRAAAGGDDAELMKAVQTLIADSRLRFSGAEAAVNAAGYALLRSGNVAAAVRAFKANTMAFANSANTYDSLGDGLRAVGDTTGALAAYRRALELNPNMDSSRRAIAELQK